MSLGRIGKTVEELLSSYATLPPSLQTVAGLALGLGATIGGLLVFAATLFVLVTLF